MMLKIFTLSYSILVNVFLKISEQKYIYLKFRLNLVKKKQLIMESKS